MKRHLLPKCPEAEQSLLGVVLQKKQLASELLAEVSIDDLFDEKNKALYRVIQEYTTKYRDSLTEEPFELPVLMDIIVSMGLDKKYEGLISYMAKLYAYNQPVHPGGYIRVVKKYAALRKAIEDGSQIVSEAYELVDPDQIAHKLEQTAKNIADQNKSGIITLSDAINELRQKTSETKYKTGILNFDRINNGFSGGELVVVAGRPAMGKTMLAINIARTGLWDGKTVGFFSIEMSAGEIANRFLMLEETFKTGDPAKYNLHIKAGRVSVNDISSYLEKLAMQGQKADLVIIDYLQLLDAPSQLRREEQISFMTRSLKQMASEHDIPILILSQLNRECEKRKNPRPILSDLRESGAIEQDADIILFIYRDEVYNEYTSERGVAEIKVAKYRNGRAGETIKLLFEPEHSRFRNMVLQDVEPPF